MTTGMIDFITRSGFITPIEDTPTPDLAVPYAAPKSAQCDTPITAEAVRRSASAKGRCGRQEPAKRSTRARPRRAHARAARPSCREPQQTKLRFVGLLHPQPAKREGSLGRWSMRWQHALAKMRATAAPMKPKNGALAGHKSVIFAWSGLRQREACDRHKSRGRLLRRTALCDRT